MKNEYCPNADDCRHYSINACGRCANCDERNVVGAINKYEGEGLVSFGQVQVPIRIDVIRNTHDLSRYRIEGYIERETLSKEERDYIDTDIASTKELWFKNNSYLIVGRRNGKTMILNELMRAMMNNKFGVSPFAIEKVIFNPPATVVLWADGTKTVVKVQNDEEFDSEKGLAMAIAKKALGNKGSYFDTIKKWTDEYEAKLEADSPIIPNLIDAIRKGISDSMSFMFHQNYDVDLTKKEASDD